MSDVTDKGNPSEEVEKEWDKYDRISFPYAKNNLPRNHPSYRNQFIIPSPINISSEFSQSLNVSNTVTPTKCNNVANSLDSLKSSSHMIHIKATTEIAKDCCKTSFPSNVHKITM